MDGVFKPVGMASPALPTERAAGARTCWPEFLLILGATSITVGIIWDISWHISIGRDTFWTPAHLAIYFGGVVAGCVGGWLAIKHTFLAEPAEQEASVRILGARAPLGAWVAIWGAIAMLTSAPFDNWWHNAYGLDVKIISPPHVVLGAGLFAISVAALLLAASRQNREPEGVGGGMFIYAGGIFLTLGAVFLTEFVLPNLQHAGSFYRACCLLLVVRLVTVGRASRLSWATTRVAAVYMAIMCLMVWILPLFPARPKLAPIFNPVTHMVPPTFPLLLVLPALGIDAVLQAVGERDRGWRRVGIALVLGAVFLCLLLVAQWFFSAFLLTPAANNWFFVGNRFWGYGTGPGPWHAEFWHVNPADDDADLLTVRALVVCWVFASFFAWLGLLWGAWMKKVKR